MKKSKALIKTQRRSLDEKLSAFTKAKTVINPKSGWIRAIRESLGMSTSQLAERMGIKQSGISLLEKRETNKTVSLETLQRAARAMNCELVYAIVPRQKLEDIVDEQSLKSATEILKKTTHSMELEMQSVGKSESSLHLKELAAELKNKLDRRLWGRK